MASSADIRMNQASVASDGSYVYAEAADGSLVKISKASLASLIKTLIGNATSTTSGLMSATDKNAQFIARGFGSYEVNNADSINTRGIYRFNASAGDESTRNPILERNWGILIVFTAHSDANPVAQLFIPSDRSFFAYRINYEYGGIGQTAWTKLV